MKMKKLFAVALAAIFLATGCTKEIIIDNTNDPVPTEKGVSYVKFNLSTEGIGTKAANDHYGAIPTDDELKIYNYAVFIFNSNGILEASLSRSIYSPPSASDIPAKDDYNMGDLLDFDPNEAYNPLYMDNQQVVTLSAGTKYFFAVLNAPQSLLDKQEAYLANNGLTQAVAQDQTITFEDLSKIVGSYYFEGDPSTPEFDNDPETTGNRGFLMTSGSLERKTLAEMEEGDTPEVITLEVGRGMAKVSLASDLSNQVDDSQPNGVLEVWSYKAINNPKAMYVMPNSQGSVLITPNYFYRQTLTEQYVTENYFHSTTDYLAASVNGNRTFTYCIENSNLTPRKGNSTAVTIHGKYYPDILYNEDETVTETNGNNPNSDGTFWRVKNVTTGEYNSRYYYEEPDLSAVSDIEPGETYEVIKYEEGECYYIIYLRNTNKPAEEYSVYRNSYYQIDIESVEGAGEPNEGDLIPDPDDPIDPETYLKVNIKIAEWEVIDQPGKL
ncbi:MAG: Mfa1 family fimbria major subunit [Tannerellaceae bacterium]|nr:Mfa1 family fimbria major subunit [Tannerellaceae bacterium]